MSQTKIVLGFDEVMLASEKGLLKNGCLVDTSILFAGSYDMDIFNTETLELFNLFGELRVSLYTNINVRAEFIDLHRRVMVPEGLCSLFSERGKSLPAPIYSQLQIVNTKMNNARNENKPYKFNDENIKQWRERLSGSSSDSSDAWIEFCHSYLQGKIENIWVETCDALKVNFLSSREGDKEQLVSKKLLWEDMASIVGEFGVGSFDAMIINLFLNSNLSAIITTDKDIAYVIQKKSPEGKIVILPRGLRV